MRQRRDARHAVALGVVAVAATMLVAPAAQAATLTVATASDTSASACTLRDAISSANGDADSGQCVAADLPYGADSIEFDPAVTGTITLGSDLPEISDDLSIFGPGADQLAISGNDARRVLSVQSFVPFDLSDLTIEHGKAPTTPGATSGGGIVTAGDTTLDGVIVKDNNAVLTGAPDGAAVDGGAIIASGTLTIIRSTIKDNHARISGSGAVTVLARGGAISHQSGTLTIVQSTLSGNDATATVTSPSGLSSTHGEGGAIYMDNTNVTFDRSTLSGNLASASGSTCVPCGFDINIARGGAYHENSQNKAFLAKGSTIAGNIVSSGSASGAGGANLSVSAFTASGGSAKLEDTIVANPIGASNCSGADFPAMTSGGFNLEFPVSNASAGCLGSNAQSTDLENVDPLLDPAGLANNGGPTQTIALLSTSPAIDQGKNFAVDPDDPDPDADQRDDDVDLPRISDKPSLANAAGGDGSDIGAFEFQHDLTAPNTMIGSLSINHSTGKARIRFSSTEPGSTFSCKIDSKAFKACHSPVVYRHLKAGRHKFRVFATDAAGNPDPAPAVKKFKV
ncbi:MAG: hypothetical protein QOG26_904 [Solirubrobacterales bacterium]|nr:hypothetical protein [Solirubrobacterales bacterium]